MLCCAAGALILAPLAMWSRARTWLSGRAAAAIGMVLIVVAALLTANTIRHLGHHAARARANQTSLLAQIAAQPICSGAPAARPPPVG